MMQLAGKGYLCSQIIILLGLEYRGQINHDLVKSLNGLAEGCGEGSCTCGALTGGCCLLSLFVGKGTDVEVRNENYQKMLTELVQWFWKEFGFNFGGIDCMAIREANAPESVDKRCWMIIEAIYNKVTEILSANGYNIMDRDSLTG
jgi:C_GCAxxG_C_C family probable redox protein